MELVDIDEELTSSYTQNERIFYEVPKDTTTNVGIILVGEVANNPIIWNAAKIFNVPVFASADGLEYLADKFNTNSFIFVLSYLEGNNYRLLCKKKQCVLAASALLYNAELNGQQH